MNQYHKIQTVYLRNPDDNYKTLLEGQFAKPEFEYLQNNEWVFTEKVDGTNIRIMWDGDNIIFGGKTNNAQIPAFLVNKLQKLFLGTVNKKRFLEKFGEDGGVCLYGEGYGKKI
jgi:ATP-dependent RNA circularization protein (DNA/RNA ligase family)